MKICILYKEKKGPWGGGNQFLKALRKEFEREKYYEPDPFNADAVIFNSFDFLDKKILNKIVQLKKKGKILIHRVDGPISTYRGKDFYLDKLIFKFNNLFADGTVFQSEWSRNKNYELGLKKNKFETVMHNASDPDIFNKKGKIKFSKNRKTKLIATSWSSNCNKGFEIYKWLDNNLDFTKYEMTFVGRTPVEFKNIKHIHPVDSKKLAKILKKHDIFITASRNDSCSNSLIETMSCGLPAIALNSGGNPELVKNKKNLFNTKEELMKKIKQITGNYPQYKTQILAFSLNKTTNQYYNFCLKIFTKQKQKENSIWFIQINLIFLLIVYIPLKKIIIQFRKFVNSMFKNTQKI